MKTQKLLLFFSLFIFSFSFLHAQKWLWGETANNSSDTWGVATDNKGNAYLSGYFNNSIKFGIYNLTSPDVDSYLIKYDSSGNILWAAQSLSSSNSSAAQTLFNASDNFGNEYVTGFFDGNVNFGSFTLTAIPNSVFLVKYDAGGSVVWAEQSISRAHNSTALGAWVATDNAGNIYITGRFFDTVSFGATTLITPIISGTGCIYLVKYNTNGNTVWARQADIPSSLPGDFPNWVSTDNFGNVYLTGTFYDTISFGSYTLRSPRNGFAGNVFLVKYDSNGNVKWAKQGNVNPGASAGNGNSVVVDNAGHVYLTGWFSDTISFGPYSLKSSSSGIYGDIFLTKYDSSGNVIWSEQSSHTSARNGWSGYSLAIDTFNNIYMTAGAFSLGKGKINFGKESFTYSSSALDPSLVLELDTSGNVVCGNIECTGGDDNSTIAVGPSGKYDYWGGDALRAIVFGKDTLLDYGEQPFVARWEPCACKISAMFSGKTSICPGEGTTLTGLGGTSYSWSTGSTEQSITVSPQVTTTYTLSEHNGDCSGDTVITVTVQPLPSVDVCCTTTISAGDSVQLTASGGVTYVWYPSTGLSCDSCPNPIAKPAQTTTYTLIITNDSGCTVETSVTIYIGEAGCGTVFVPNVFSPNQDGHNDVLYVRGDCIATMDFNVFDRWGNKVFESQNINNGWDGTYKSQPMNAATFVWYLKATLLDGTQLDKKGNVTLVR